MTRVAARDVPFAGLVGLGERIVVRRKSLGLGRRDLARLAGLGESHLLNLEKGIRSDPSASTIARLSTALQVSADYLLGIKDECDTCPEGRRQLRP